MRLPEALLTDSDDHALRALHAYNSPRFGAAGFFTGSLFDQWDSTGTRAQDSDRFTADDLLAVTFLSVSVPPSAAHLLLRERAEQFAELLDELGPDRDLVDEPGPLADDWVGWKLMSALRELPRVGPTTASKLIARKRPRLRPIYDTVVAAVTDSVDSQWEPLRQLLVADDRALHRRLLRLQDAAGLPEAVSALRVFDVIAWMQPRSGGGTDNSADS
jgi:hypothetical protein